MKIKKEVITCENCKHGDVYATIKNGLVITLVICNKHSTVTREEAHPIDWYCADGEEERHV